MLLLKPSTSETLSSPALAVPKNHPSNACSLPAPNHLVMCQCLWVKTGEPMMAHKINKPLHFQYVNSIKPTILRISCFAPFPNWSRPHLSRNGDPPLVNSARVAQRNRCPTARHQGNPSATRWTSRGSRNHMASPGGPGHP